MAQEAVDSAGLPKKRGPGRPRKSSLEPVTKRLKRASDAFAHLDDSDSRERRPRGLPTKLNIHHTLPVLPEPQTDLNDAEYASIAASGVLASSLERSRMSWTYSGIFERYWTKPEGGKAAAGKGVPQNNPDVKTMKSRGRCRLRIEPHIFEVELFVVDKSPPTKIYQQPRQPFVQQWQPARPAPAKPSTQQAGDQKSVTDPVIALLAERAGHDQELKDLMRDVAMGKASEARLHVFQRHINELNQFINANKGNDKVKTEQSQASSPVSTHAPSTATSGPTSVAPSPQPTAFYQRPPPPPAGPPEVVFAFTTPGACQDRFLFPQHAVVETLTPQHVLASFFVTKKGSDAVDPRDFDARKTYYFPVTIMVEVAYGREGILSDVKRWVKPTDEAREYMKTIMATCERLPPSHLALRLPLRGTADSSSMPNSHAGTPGPEEKEKRKYKLQMPAAMYKKRGIVLEGEITSEPSTPAAKAKSSSATPANGSVVGTQADANPVVKTEDSPNENRRSTRTTRKSSRLSEL